MRFLTLATHLLPVLALGGLVSGEDIPRENLHRSHNDEVYDLSEELSGNNNSNSGPLAVDPTESQSTTVSSIPTTTGQSLLPSAFGESDSIPSENLIKTTKRTDSFDAVTTKQFSDDTDRNIPYGTTETPENNGETTELSSVTLTPSNATHNQQNQTDLETAVSVDDPIPKGQETFILDDDVTPSTFPLPKLNDETVSETGKINPNVQTNVERIIDPSSNLKSLAKSNSVVGTDDISVHEKSIDDQKVQSDSELSEEIFRKSGQHESDRKTNVRGYNLPGDQYSENLDDGNGDDYVKPSEEIKNEKSPDSSAENSSNETSENWLSVLQSIVPSQKERLDFNEKMLQSIQNTVSNSNVNHNVMNNAPTLPCAHSPPPSSSNLYPPPYWLSSSISAPLLSTGVPIESDIPEEYQDFEIEAQPHYINYDDIERHDPYSPDQFVDPLIEWAVQPVETQYNPIIHVKGKGMIHRQSQAVELARRCRRILVKSEQMCKRERSICHTPWSGCKPICRPGRIICSKHPSQRLKVKLVCREIWQPVPRSRVIYSAPSYVTPDYEIFEEQFGVLHESEQDLSMPESDGCERNIPDLDILPNTVSLEEVSEPFSEMEDVVAEDEENSAVSEQVFEEAIRKAIDEAPEILAPVSIEELKSEIVQEPEPAVKVEKTVNAVNEIDKLSVAQTEVPSKSVIKNETQPLHKPKATHDSNANHNLNSNVNLNKNVNINGNIAAWQPVLPDIGVPVITPIVTPVIHALPGEDNANSNTNANVNMNLNINQNHNANVNQNKRLPIQPIVEMEPNEVSKIPQVEPTMPTFEYKAPSESVVDIRDVNQNTNVNINSNTNVNQNHNTNNQIEIPRQPKVEAPVEKAIPQVPQPTVDQSIPKAIFEPVAKNVGKNVNTNVNSNVNINRNSNVNSNIEKPKTPDIKDMEDVIIEKNPIVLPDVVLPSINQGNQDANVNNNMNLNVNSNLNKNTNENREPIISKVPENVPITIPEPVQVAEPPVEVAAPVYEVPLLPASSSSLNVNSNVNHNVNSNVNLNIINDTDKNVIQQPLTAPINQPTPASTFTPTEAMPKLVLVPQAANGTDTTVNENQNVNENLNSNLNINSNQNKNHDTTEHGTQILPEIIPVVVPEPVLTPIPVSVPVVNGDSNRNTNINHNVNRNVNINGNANAAINVPEIPNLGAPVLIPESAPAAVVPEPTLPKVMPVLSQVSQNHNINSNTNVNYNSNINNDANHEIAEPSEQPVTKVIKPVESQPVAAPKHSEIPLVIPTQTDVHQNLNENANINRNVNVNTNVNANHNVNSNANANINNKEAQGIAGEAGLFPRFTNPVVTQAPGPEFIGNNNVHVPEKVVSGLNENTGLNEDQSMNVNLNHNSNINVNDNSNLNSNYNIENQRLTLLPTPDPVPVFGREPILLPPQAQAPVSHNVPISEPEILQNANYNTNVNVNHNLNSNSNFNQNSQIRNQAPILLPALAPLPWIQDPVLQPQIAPNGGLNLIRNADVNLNQNLNTNVNHNANLNKNHNIETREQSALPATHEQFNKNNYPPVFMPDVREPVMIAAPTPVLEQKKAGIPQVTRNSQVNVNHNANVNMNYNSNYNHNANYNGKAIANENEKGKLPLIETPQNVLAPVIIPQSSDRGTGLWNVGKNSNINANYNSNMNYNANVNANSNYNLNLGQNSLGILTPGAAGTRESSPGIQSPLLTGNPASSAPMIPNTIIAATANPSQLGYEAQQNINANANYNSNLNYNSNYNSNHNQNANYNAQMTDDQKIPKKKGWYELWYNNGEDKDGWTEIWNNKQFKRFLEQQLKDMKQQEDIQAQAQAQTQSQSFAVAR